MKYHLMSHPEPSTKPLERRVGERIAEMQKIDPATGRPQMDATTIVANFHKIVQEEQDQEDDELSFYGGNARLRFARMTRRTRRRRIW
jgi:hypothetical protein